MIDGLLLIVGLLFLIKAAGLLVKGASIVASRLGISPLIVGLTVVSFGTSMPEMLVTLTAGLQQNADLAIANVVGSNIANVLLILGVAAIIRPLPVRNSTIVSEIPFSLIAALLVGFLANAALFSDHHELSISRLDGGILLFFFLLFMLYIYKSSREYESTVSQVVASGKLGHAVFQIALGVVGLYFGGQWVVSGAVGFAQTWGVDDALVGLTIVAIGTSAPELVASAVAAYRNETDIAVGNVVGSNIFNLLWVLGLTSSIVELPFKVITNTDLAMVIMSSALIIVAMVSSRRYTVLRSHGILFICLYVAYLFYVVQR
ncbi:MAG: calcium/sodium antiporter [Woeseiaceae bacterium]|nr:calcium/sodium antiporter [Woeseiaceae bacterium]